MSSSFWSYFRHSPGKGPDTCVLDFNNGCGGSMANEKLVSVNRVILSH